MAIIVYNAIIKLFHPHSPHVRPQDIWKSEMIELWWDYSIKTISQVRHNKPDIVFWLPEKKTCCIIDICIPLDENVHKQEKQKVDTYTELKVALLRLYPNYEIYIVPIVLGATGVVTTSLVTNLGTIGFNVPGIKTLIPKLQQKAMIGSMRIVKAAMTMKKE